MLQRSPTLFSQVAGDGAIRRLNDWLVGLVLGGEGERIMLQELPLSSCYSPRCMHNLRRIL